jgi:hypothetical protein
MVYMIAIAIVIGIGVATAFTTDLAGSLDDAIAAALVARVRLLVQGGVGQAKILRPEQLRLTKKRPRCWLCGGERGGGR